MHTAPSGDKHVPTNIERILWRRKVRSRSFFSPGEPCHKCGADCWVRDDGDTWSCFRCGNLGYVRGGDFVQQADLHRDA